MATKAAKPAVKKPAAKSVAKAPEKKVERRQQKIRIKIKSFDHRVIDQASKAIIETAERTGATVAGPIPLPTHIEKYTVNKSTFVHKNARDQFEIRTHKRLMDITDANAKTVESLSGLTLPAGVEIEIKMLTA